MNQEIILTLFKYFAKFVPKEVLKRMFVKSTNKESGYDEIVAELLAAPSESVIHEIDAYVFSANEKFVSQKVKNSSGIVFYVEYGAINYTPNQSDGVSQKIAIHIACPYSATNADNLQETLKMNRMHEILLSILDTMEVDQNKLEFCGATKLIQFPAEIVVIEPSLFYDRIGWMGMFDFSTTQLV